MWVGIGVKFLDTCEGTHRIQILVKPYAYYKCYHSPKQVYKYFTQQLLLCLVGAPGLRGYMIADYMILILISAVRGT